MIKIFCEYIPITQGSGESYEHVFTQNLLSEEVEVEVIEKKLEYRIGEFWTGVIRFFVSIFHFGNTTSINEVMHSLDLLDGEEKSVDITTETVYNGYETEYEKTLIDGEEKVTYFKYSIDGESYEEVGVAYNDTYYDNDILQANTQVLRTTGDNGNVSYTYGNERLYQTENSESTTYLYDGRGSVVQLLQGDTVVQEYDYSPFGQQLNETSSESYFGYNAESYNPISDLQYLRARYYSPTTANFITQDSFTGLMTDVLSQNRYSYVNNNPINYIDPTGHFLQGLWDGVKNVASGIVSGVKTAVSAVTNVVKGIGSAIGSAVQTVTQAITGSNQSTQSSSSKTSSNTYNHVTNTVGNSVSIPQQQTPTSAQQTQARLNSGPEYLTHLYGNTTYRIDLYNASLYDSVEDYIKAKCGDDLERVNTTTWQTFEDEFNDKNNPINEKLSYIMQDLSYENKDQISHRSSTEIANLPFDLDQLKPAEKDVLLNTSFINLIAIRTTDTIAYAAYARDNYVNVDVSKGLEVISEDGDKYNALYHIVWMAKLSNITNADVAERMGDAHESQHVNENWDQSVEGVTIERTLAEHSYMDLKNNSYGVNLGSDGTSEQEQLNYLIGHFGSEESVYKEIDLINETFDHGYEVFDLYIVVKAMNELESYEEGTESEVMYFVD